LKSYNTVTQSIGRGMRKSEDKSVFTIYDIVDVTGFKGVSGMFVKSYYHRLKTSYRREDFDVREYNYRF